MFIVDPSKPIETLRRNAHKTKAAVARALGVAHSWGHKAEKRGYRIKLNTLLDAAEACGFRIEIHAFPIAPPVVEVEPTE